MYDRPPDIQELERMLADGECDALLNSKAIEIFKRLVYERKVIGSFGSNSLLELLEDERTDFLSVIASIQEHRHTHVLDEFEAFVKAHK